MINDQVDRLDKIKQLKHFQINLIEKCSSQAEAGFTLLEVLIVLAIVGLVFSMVAMHARAGDPRLALEAATAQLRDGLIEARSTAILQDRPVRFVIDTRPPAGVHEDFRGPAASATTTDAIVFQGDGSASGGLIILAGKGGRARIAVDWLTGRISLTEGEGGGDGTARR